MMLNEYEFRQTVVNMRNKTVELEREGEYWEDEEREQLVQLFEAGTGLTSIAMILRRTEMAVIQQALQLNLFSPPHARRPYIRKPPRCRCSICKVPPAQCPKNPQICPMQEVPHAE